MRRPRAHWLAATLLVTLSVGAGLAVCEAVLRFAHPRYAHIASARLPQPPALAAVARPFASPEEMTWRGDYAEPQVVAAAAATFHRVYRAIAARRPAARARWNVYVSDAGATFTYLKEPCTADDLNDRFFVRRLPADVPHVDGPDSVAAPDGFASLSFSARFRAGVPEREVAAQMFDGKCLVRNELPNWPAQTVRTGQTDGDSVLWDTTFHVDEERFRHAWRWATRSPPRGAGLVRRPP